MKSHGLHLHCGARRPVHPPPPRVDLWKRYASSGKFLRKSVGQVSLTRDGTPRAAVRQHRLAPCWSPGGWPVHKAVMAPNHQLQSPGRGPVHHSLSPKDQPHGKEVTLELPYCIILQNVSTNGNSSCYVLKARLNNNKAKRLHSNSGEQHRFSTGTTHQRGLQREWLVCGAFGSEPSPRRL